MKEILSEELFDSFRSSDWPIQFSDMAQAASSEGVTLDEHNLFPIYQTSLILAPKEELQILKDLDIIEDQLVKRGVVTPSMLQDGFPGDPNTYQPIFSNFGKQVIMACENLFTIEELDAATKAVAADLDNLSDEPDAALIYMRKYLRR